MQYAIIENELCTNIIEAEEDFAATLGAVQLLPGFGIGDAYINQQWISHHPSTILELTQAELKQQYEDLTVELIRQRYTQNDENKILREYLAEMANVNVKSVFSTYNTYVTECKSQASLLVYGAKQQVIK